MVFIEWWLALQVCTIVLLVTSRAYGIWVVRGKRWLLRLPVRVVSLLLLLLGVGDAVFVWAFPNPITTLYRSVLQAGRWPFVSTNAMPLVSAAQTLL